MDQYDKIKNPANGYFSPEGVPVPLGRDAASSRRPTTATRPPRRRSASGSGSRRSTAGSPATGRRSTTPGRRWRSTSSRRHADQPDERRLQPGRPGRLRARVQPAQPVPVAAATPASRSAQDPLAPSCSPPTAPATSTACTGCSTWTTPTASAGRASLPSDGDARRPSVHQHLPARPAGVGLGDRCRSPSCDTFRLRRPERLPADLFIEDSHLRQAVELHRRPRRRRARRPGRLLGADLGHGAGQAVADLGHRRQGRQDGRLPALRDVRQVLQEARLHQRRLRRRAPARTARRYLLSLVLRLGRRERHHAGWAWRIGSSHNHCGYQNPLAAWALSSRPAALQPQSPTASADWATSLTRQLEFYTWLQSAEGAIAGGATNSWDGHYASPPAGTADVLRHGLRLAAGLPRPAVEPVVRLPGVGHGAGGRATTT